MRQITIGTRAILISVLLTTRTLNSQAAEPGPEHPKEASGQVETNDSALPAPEEKKFLLKVETLSQYKDLVIKKITVKTAREKSFVYSSFSGEPVSVRSAGGSASGRMSVTGFEKGQPVSIGTILLVVDVFKVKDTDTILFKKSLQTHFGSKGFRTTKSPQKGDEQTDGRELLNITVNNGIYSYGEEVELGKFIGKPITIRVGKGAAGSKNPGVSLGF